MAIRGSRQRRSALTVLAGLFFALLAVPQTAYAAKWFVDDTLGDVKPEEKVVPATPKPVQVLFEFQRDGAPNPAATRQVKPWALADLKTTGAFADVTEAPVAGGAVLSIKFNNVVNQQEVDQAKRQGFRAGLGFGLFGGVVAIDHYVVTMEYIASIGSQPIVTVVNHALSMKYGSTNAPVSGTQVRNANEAVQMIVRQAMARGVNNIAADPAFPR